jgi:hypothetical protein
MLLVTFRKRSKHLGTLEPAHCQHCRTVTNWEVTKYRTWLCIWLLPILPVARAQYWVGCGNCNAGLQVEKATIPKDDVPPVKQDNKLGAHPDLEE